MLQAVVPLAVMPQAVMPLADKMMLGPQPVMVAVASFSKASMKNPGGVPGNEVKVTDGTAGS